MLTLPALFLLNALQSGLLPLHAGATWTWRITDRSGNQTLRTATAVDSTADDTGSVWTLSVKDSASDRVDSTKLRAYPNGTQGWIKDPVLRFDLESWSTRTPTFGGWGYVLWSNWFIQKAAAIREPTSSKLVRTVGMDLNPYVWEEKEIPSSTWDPTHGLVRCKQGDVSWLLVSHDGKPISTQGDSLVVPKTGTSWVWNEASSTTSHQLRWEIRSRDDDSLGWVRLAVLCSKISATGTDTSILHLRLNPVTRQRIPARSAAWDPDEAWWLRLGDSVLTNDLLGDPALANGSWRGRYYANTFWINHYGTTSRSNGEYLWMIPGQAIVQHSYFTKKNDMDGAVNSSLSRTLVFPINGVAVSPAAVAIDPASRAGKTGTSFTALARIHPNVLIRWRDARGRGGMVPAATLLANATGISPRIVFVEAVFPDGSSWKGPVLTSGQLRH